MKIVRPQLKTIPKSAPQVEIPAEQTSEQKDEQELKTLEELMAEVYGIIPDSAKIQRPTERVKVYRVCLKLTPTEHKRLQDLGGSFWMMEKIREARILGETPRKLRRTGNKVFIDKEKKDE